MEGISSDTPILNHSMNPADVPKTDLALSKSCFCAAKIPITEMTEEKFSEWLQEPIDT